ncbi:MAG TPA: c-type cytochrome [Rhizomicrobium sp.]
MSIVKRAFFAITLAAAFGTEVAAQGVVARGEYLTILGDCAGCHTAARGPAYAGGLPFVAAFGTIYSPNITPDKRTGIGTWTSDQFYRALHEGIASDGRRLYPAFPFPYFTRVTRSDCDALYAYLRTIKPVNATRPANKLIPPFNIRALMTIWDGMYFDKGTFRNDSSRSSIFNRGSYIVNGLGHCAACHTPKNLLFGDEKDKPLTGDTQEGWYSANLNGNRRDGLGRWNIGDIVQYLKTGRNRFAAAAGTMQEKVTSSTSRMSDGDLKAIAIYLKSLAAIPEPTPTVPKPAAMHNGQAIFVENCSACHSEPGAGRPRDYPDLDGDTLVMGYDSETVIRIVLEGAESARTKNAPTTFSMPSFGALSDKDVADVTSFIRNMDGNHASPVSAQDVAAVRKTLLRTAN